MTNTETINNIEVEIQKEQVAFHNAIYDGVLPKGFMDKCEKAFMETKPSEMKMLAASVEKVLDKKADELTNIEVGVWTNLISTVPPKNMYSTRKEATKSMKELDNIRLDFNLKVRLMEKQLNEKKSRLVQLSGASLSNSKLISV